MTGAELAKLLADFGEHQALVLAAIFIASLVLEDAATIGAALLAAQGLVDPALGIAVLCLGTGSGDVALHLAGRWARRHAWVDRQCVRPPVARAARWLTLRRWPTLFLARFVPGLRLPTYLASGLLNLSTGRCAVVIAAATVLWTPCLFLLSMTSWAVLSSVKAELVVVTGLVVPALLLWSRMAETKGGGSRWRG